MDLGWQAVSLALVFIISTRLRCAFSFGRRLVPHLRGLRLGDFLPLHALASRTQNGVWSLLLRGPAQRGIGGIAIGFPASMDNCASDDQYPHESPPNSDQAFCRHGSSSDQLERSSSASLQQRLPPIDLKNLRSCL